MIFQDNEKNYLTIGEDLLDFKAEYSEDRMFIATKIRLMLNRLSENDAKRCLSYAEKEKEQRDKSAKYQLFLAKLRTFAEYDDLAYVRIKNKAQALANMATVLKHCKDPNVSIINVHYREDRVPTRTTDDELRTQLAAIVEEYSSKKLVGAARNIIIRLSKLMQDTAIITENCEIIDPELIEQVEELGKLPIEDGDLSVRSFNGLKKAGINDFKDTLIAYFRGDLRNIKYLGYKSIHEIEERLHIVFGSELIEKLRETNWWTS